MMRSKVFALYALLILFPAVLTAAALDDSVKLESAVVLYSSLSNEQIVTLVEAFRTKYPNIKPSFNRGTGERVLQRALTEAKTPLRRRCNDIFDAR